MSISDSIVVMKDGVIQQIGKPQAVYDDPVNLFVAKFLGNPPINVFEGQVKGGRLYIGSQPVLEVPGVSDQPVYAAIRPEGLCPDQQGPFCCQLKGVEVLGRDISVVADHPSCLGRNIRAIVPSSHALSGEQVRFRLVPEKVFLFRQDTQERIG